MTVKHITAAPIAVFANHLLGRRQRRLSVKPIYEMDLNSDCK